MLSVTEAKVISDFNKILSVTTIAAIENSSTLQETKIKNEKETKIDIIYSFQSKEFSKLI